MEEKKEKKKRLFDLPETKGVYQLKGIVTGTKKENFYKELKTKNNKNMRIVNFGIMYDKNCTLFTNIQGTEQELVYFSKRAENKGEKSTTESVAWSDRFSFNKEGFRLIGKNIGIKKIANSEGKLVNDKKVLVDFDACKEVHENLKDDMSVFTKGNVEFSSYIDDKGNKRNGIKLIPNQISLCADIDFDAEDYEAQNDFNQVIIFIGIDKEKDDAGKETGRFVVSSKIVTYNTIEDVEFIIVDSKLASLFKKNLKAYNAIKVSGQIVSSVQTEEVTTDDDDWGEADKIERVSAPVKREFIITGAKGSSIERELYTEDKINDAIAKINNKNKAEQDFGGSSDSDWGSIKESEEDDDDSWD